MNDTDTSVLKVCKKSADGVFKRIDENRELLELLHREVPELLKRCPYLEGWLEGQDIFLTDLAKVMGLEPLSWMGRADCPRPWPGTRSLEPYLMKF